MIIHRLSAVAEGEVEKIGEEFQGVVGVVAEALFLELVVIGAFEEGCEGFCILGEIIPVVIEPYGEGVLAAEEAILAKVLGSDSVGADRVVVGEEETTVFRPRFALVIEEAEPNRTPLLEI